MEEITIQKINLINKLCLKEGENNNIISQDRLLSALSNQYQPYDCDGKIIASLYKAIVLDHAFENGNKRTAVITIAYLANSIGLDIKLSDKALCNLTYRIADEGGSKIQVDYLYSILFNKVDSSLDSSLNDFVVTFCSNHKWLIDKLSE